MLVLQFIEPDETGLFIWEGLWKELVAKRYCFVEKSPAGKRKISVLRANPNNKQFVANKHSLKQLVAKSRQIV